jgi:hypothetical protein
MPSALSSDQGGHTAAGVAACGSGAEAQEMTLAELIASEGGLPEVLGAEPDERVNGCP